MHRRSNLVLLIIVIIVCFVGGEIAIRSIKGFRAETASNPYQRYNDTLGWLGKPGFHDSVNTGWAKVHYQIDSWGFRVDPPTARTTTEGKLRILLLGDSFMEGYGIESRDRLSSILMNLDTNLVVYNLGVVGYSTDQELLVLEKFGSRIKPDVVVLFFCLNDLLNNSAPYNYGRSKPIFHLRPDSSLDIANVPVPRRPRIQSMILWVKDHLALGHYSFKVMDRCKSFHYWIYPGPEGIMDSTIYIPDTLIAYSNSSPPQDMTRYLMKAINAQCHQLKAKLLVCSTVDGFQYCATHERTPEATAIVLQWCQTMGISVLDFYPIFRKSILTSNSHLFAADGYHWNYDGNELVAKILQDSLNHWR